MWDNLRNSMVKNLTKKIYCCNNKKKRKLNSKSKTA